MRFTEVWEKIVTYQGSDFRTKRGKLFMYYFTPEGGVTVLFDSPSVTRPGGQTGPIASRSVFEKAFRSGKCIGPGAYTSLGIGGQSYVWAILHDPRINAFE
jgi:hypothetical protein